jgi:hypothetical protein
MSSAFARGSILDAARASLAYLAWRSPYRDRVSLGTLRSHPAGVVYDDRLFNERAPLAAHLNAKCAAQWIDDASSRITDDLGVPTLALMADDVHALAPYYAMAGESPRCPADRCALPDTTAHIHRVPNAAAAAAIIELAATSEPRVHPTTLYMRDRWFIMRIDDAADAWFVATADHRSDSQMLMGQASGAGVDEDLYCMLSGLSAGSDCGLTDFWHTDAALPGAQELAAMVHSA